MTLPREPRLRLVFVLPTKNERATIRDAISSLRQICLSRQWQCDIVVADDSDDDTAAISRELGALVIDGGRVGLGQAMARGLSVALELAPDWIISMDTDGQVDLDEIPDFIALAHAQSADVLISSRFLSDTSFDYPYPFVNWLGNRLLVATLRLATGRKFTDSHGGIRVMKPHAIRGLRLIGRHTYVQETLIQMHRRGCKIIEVPSRWKERSHGGSRVLHSIFRYVYRTSPALLCHLKVPVCAAAMGAVFFLDSVFLKIFPEMISALAAFAFGLTSLFLFTIQNRALLIDGGRAR